MNEPNNAAIPEKIKIGDNEYSIKDNPALLSLIETVRTQEKKKLHSEIKTLEAVKTDLENKVKNGDTLTAAQKTELDNAKNQLAVANSDKTKIEDELKLLKSGKPAQPGSDIPPDQNAPKTGITLEAIAELLSKQEKALTEKFTAEVAEVRSSLTQTTAAQYLKEKLKDNEGLVIPDLVVGNTKEEIDASLAKALDISKKYIQVTYNGKPVTLAEKEAAEAAKLKTPPQPPAPPANAGTPPPAPNYSGNGDFSGKSLVADVSKMNAEEYAKYRSGILREVQQMSITETESVVE